jgi:hypothetical protein
LARNPNPLTAQHNLLGCHAGAEVSTYGGYLEAKYRADFEAWEAAFVNPTRI